MASKEKMARAEQKAYWEEKLNQRLSMLSEKGAEPSKIARDPTVREFRARIREAENRLKAIEQKEKKMEEMARIRAEKLSAPKKKGKRKKESEDKPAVSKRQQKKKKKKEGKNKT